MTPLHLEILMHHHVSPEPFPRDSYVIRSYRQYLIEVGLLGPGDEPQVYTTTDKGKAWIKKALSTPMPTQKWVWEP